MVLCCVTGALRYPPLPFPAQPVWGHGAQSGGTVAPIAYGLAKRQAPQPHQHPHPHLRPHTRPDLHPHPQGINLAQAQLTGQLVCVTPPLADTGSPDGLGASNGCVDGTGSGAGAGAGDTSWRGAAAAGSRLQRLCAAVRAAAEQQPQGAGAAAAAAAAAVAGVALLIDSLTVG